MRRSRTGLGIFIFIIYTVIPTSFAMSGEGEDLQNLTGQVVPLVSTGPTSSSFMAGGELHSRGHLTSRSDIQYTVQVKNQTGDPIIGSSLILVIEQILEVGGTQDATSRLGIQGADGQTDKNKPFFQVPTGTTDDLAPYGVSDPIQIRIRNPDLLRLAPPTFSIYGVRRTKTKQIEDLREALIQKGILSPEEATDILGSPHPATPNLP